MPFYQDINKIVAQSIYKMPGGEVIGYSREQRAIYAYKFGSGLQNISLIAGNHADEPTGPDLLRKLVVYLAALPPTHPMLQAYSWYIVPHVNPDNERVNARWFEEGLPKGYFNLAKYLSYAHRELPGSDIEYGYPIAGKIGALRPENEAVYNFWQQAKAPFGLHASLHGMAYSYGAWFLIEKTWQNRTQHLQQTCIAKTKALGYLLHDVDRKGEKGFYRIAAGFTTRPDSEGMRQHFLGLNNPEMAAKFHPSSMESIRSLGGNCLTLVSEMPLFILPKLSNDISWPNQPLLEWYSILAKWKTLLKSKTSSEKQVNEWAKNKGIHPMPIKHQQILQWTFICAGLEEISKTT